ERALAMLRNAGLAYDPKRSWAEHFAEIGARGRDRGRLALLNDQLIPEAEKRLRPGSEIDGLRAQLKQIESQAASQASDAGKSGDGPKKDRSAIELEQERAKLEKDRERVEKRRADLRVQIDETSRRYHAEHPEKEAQRERIQRALEHARRFKQA